MVKNRRLNIYEGQLLQLKLGVVVLGVFSRILFKCVVHVANNQLSDKFNNRLAEKLLKKITMTNSSNKPAYLSRVIAFNGFNFTSSIIQRAIVKCALLCLSFQFAYYIIMFMEPQT